MKLRKSNVEKLKKDEFDVLIIGGGMNGAVSAASIAAKGVKVALIDKGDFAGETSQESSNLIWGGIKYLETLEFFLVRNLCKSRNKLMKNYPSIVKEIRFFTSVYKGFRFPVVFIWLGAWLYWFIGGLFTKVPRFLFKSDVKRDEPIVNLNNFAGGFEYSDCYLHDNDARFVFSFIRQALSFGLIGANYISSVKSIKKNDLWISKVKDEISGEEFDITSKVIINALGPYADTYNNNSNIKTDHHLVFSKGIHLIVNKLTCNKRVLTFFASDGRPFFLIPMGVRTCIGTTDTRVKSPTKEITIEDKKFVLDNVNSFLNLKKPLCEEDIIASRCGVRPLVVEGSNSDDKDWMQLSRKHVIEVDKEKSYLTIFGGKLTDCLNVGDEVAEYVGSMGVNILHQDFKWYGEPDNSVKKEFFHRAKLIGLDELTSPHSSEQLSARLWRRYGDTAIDLLELIQEDTKQADVLIEGTEYIRCELIKAAQREMVTKLSDFLRRRSKIALIEKTNFIKNSEGLLEAAKLLFNDQAQEKIDEYFSETNQKFIR